jgi:glycosyltransferase involved in cell wall biosynthesis
MSFDSSAAFLVDALASAQLTEDGSPRFFVTPRPSDPSWPRLVEEEQNGGVLAELRVFLDEQLESTDLLLDLAPGAGFLALSAATAPAGTVRVAAVVATSDEARLLEHDARRAGVRVSTSVREDMLLEGLSAWCNREATGVDRIFLHVTANGVNNAVRVFEQCSITPTAILIDASDATQAAWTSLHRALRSARFVPHVLAEQQGQPVLFATDTDDVPSRIIALPETVLVSGKTDSVIASEGEALDVETEEMDVQTVNVPSPTDSASASKSWNIFPVLDSVATSFNFIAPFCRTGYGVAGANLLKSLLDLRVDVAFFPLGLVDQTIAEVPGLVTSLARQDNFSVGAPSVRLSQQFDLAMHVGTGPRIGFPIFELDRFTPRELHHLRAQDRLLVCSAWARDAMRANGVHAVPIDVVPLGVDRTIFHEHVLPATSRKETVFVQVGKLEPRKGQLDFLRAFEAAFTPSDKVRMVLVCHNPFVDPARMAAALAPFRTSPMARNIDIVTTPLATHHDVARLIQSADCGVYCSRAEGWNLELLETLSMGKTVIATNYSAHTEFLSPSNAKLVEIDALEVAGAGHWAAFGARQHEAFVTHLRAVHSARLSGPLPLNAAGIATAKRYSWEHSARALLSAIRTSSHAEQ